MVVKAKYKDNSSDLNFEAAKKTARGRRYGSKNSYKVYRLKYVQQPERNLFLHVLKRWIVDIKKGKYTRSEWFENDDFLRIINLSGLGKEAVYKVIEYLQERPYEYRKFDVIFSALVNYGYKRATPLA